MKDEINLLPPSALAERKDSMRARRERALIVAVASACGIVLLTYGAIWWALYSLQASFTDQIVLQNKDRTAIIDRSREINREAALLDSKTSSVTRWTSRIPDVLSSVPNGILISRLELVGDPETLVVTGTASEGSAVVVYQSALEKLPWVDRVVAPLQNFARSPEATVTFTIFHTKEGL